MKKGTPLLLLLVFLFTGSQFIRAQQEIGHFAPGVLGIRDFAVPEPGFYGALYNYFYSTTRLNDNNGNKINSFNVGPGAGVTVTPSIDVDVYAVAPTLIWISKKKIFGAKYGAYLSPSFSNTSIGASLKTTTGSGRSAAGSQFALADLFVQPLWLGWTKTKWDLSFGYGFYAPVGKYNTETLTFPVIGSMETEAADNIGLGFWTHQFQVGASHYPWQDRRMAIATAFTYEVHGNKTGFDLKPGQNFTFNWGVSQYLPLKNDGTLLLEIGPTGYDSWQVKDDSGNDSANPPVLDQVHSLGLQLGLTAVPLNASLNLHYFNEVSSKNRFQGSSFGLNLAFRI